MEGKYLHVCGARHGVKKSNSYLHENTAKEFMHFISESKSQSLFSSISSVKRFSLPWMVLLTKAKLITMGCRLCQNSNRSIFNILVSSAI